MEVGWLALALTPGVGPRRFLKAQARHPDDPAAAAGALGPEILAAYRKVRDAGVAERVLERAEHLSTRVLGPGDPGYPEGLSHLADPPVPLFVKGEVPPWEAAVAIVGTRRASPWAKGFARELAAALARAGATVVSGLARGIDGAAHRGALEAGGKTLAVLGSGLDRIYPPEHRELAERMALVSEFPFGTGPRPEHFPRRNRLIAALARAVVVVEAPERSGALITARFALELGREVLAVPGRPTDEKSRGANRLIADGAPPVLGPEELLEYLGLKAAPEEKPKPPPHLRELYEALRQAGEALPDDLAQNTGKDAGWVLAGLTELELLGLAEALPGGRYRAR